MFGRELADSEVDEIFWTEWRVEADVRVFELDRDAAIRVLAEGHLAEVGDMVAECAGAEQVHLLGKLQIVVDAGDRSIFVERRRIQARQLHVDGERHRARDLAGPDRFRPQALVSRRAQADRLLLHHVLGLSRHPVASQPERFAERVQFREHRVARLTAGLVLPRERRHCVGPSPRFRRTTTRTSDAAMRRRIERSNEITQSSKLEATSDAVMNAD